MCLPSLVTDSETFWASCFAHHCYWLHPGVTQWVSSYIEKVEKWKLQDEYFRLREGRMTWMNPQDPSHVNLSLPTISSMGLMSQLFLSILVILLILFICSCGSSNQRSDDRGLQYDTTKIVILSDSSGKRGVPLTLGQDDLPIIENLLHQCIKDYNSGSHIPLQDLKSYRRQYIPEMNYEHQKEVWVNCFCHSGEMGWKWKSQVVSISDGGTCYFNVKINLTKSTYSDLLVNGSP